MKSTISSKGQITVPIEIRERLGLRAGTPVVFETRSDGALLRKAPLAGHPVDHVFGSLRIAVSVDATLDALRGARVSKSAARRARSK
jgi:AbrB family looped-hinge helix DNA binding protein